MSERHVDGPLQPGDRAPSIVLDAITREGKIALDDFRGHSPVLVGLYRGLFCPFCRRHIAAQAQLGEALRERGVESISVINTPIDRARLYFRYHPHPHLLAAADPERASHRAFGLPTLQFTESQTNWPHQVAINAVTAMRIDLPDELPEPMNPFVAGDFLNKKDAFEMTEADEQMKATGMGQLFGEFLLDRDGIVRWSFTEVDGGGRHMFGAPTPQEVMSAAVQVAS